MNPQGEAIPDVAVTITNAATRQTHSSTTAADGAYGFSMSSNYNSRPRAVEVLVEGDRFRVIRERETYKDLIRGETT